MHSQFIFILLCILSLSSFMLAQKNTQLVLTGQLKLDEAYPIDDAQFKMLKGKVIDTIAKETTANQACFTITVSFSEDKTTSGILADYNLGLDLADCEFGERMVISNVSETLGVDTLIFKQTIGKYSGAFWEDPMNSILVFAGCGALVLVIIVICITVLCRQCIRGSTHSSASLASTTKLMSFQAGTQSTPPTTYAADTLVMDVSRPKSGVVNGSTTIERWVHSELGRSRIQKDAEQVAACSHDMMTTDSGIVTVSPTEERTKDHPYDDTRDSNEPQLSHYKRMDSTFNLKETFPSMRVVNEVTTPKLTDNSGFVTRPDLTSFTLH